MLWRHLRLIKMGQQMSNGCYNRPHLQPTFLCRDGYRTGIANGHVASFINMIPIENRNSRDCQYSKTTYDANCTGCRHNLTKLEPTNG